jgi:hypothetical protein
MAGAGTGPPDVMVRRAGREATPSFFALMPSHFTSPTAKGLTASEAYAYYCTPPAD